MSVKTYSLKKDGSKKLSANFKVSEFKCKDGSDKILISDELVTLLQRIRDHFGKPVTINSAYRNAAYNIKVGGASKSQHVVGTAADIVVKGINPTEVTKYVEYIMPNTGGIGLYNTFTHVDVRTKRSRWKNSGKDVSVSGFPGYVPETKEAKPEEKKSEPFKYKITGITHIIEVDPSNLSVVETQCSTKSVKQDNFVNGTFFMAQANGKMYPLGITVDNDKVYSNYITHNKPVATLIIYKNGNVDMKYILDITKEKNVKLAISGYGIYPSITATQEGFTGVYSDVLRSTNRPIIGYRKKDNKIVIAVRSSSSAQRANTTAKNLGLDFAISLDAGGSTTLKVNGKYKFKGDGRKIFGGLTWK